MSDAFERVVFRGKLMDRKTMAFLMKMEEKLGYELTITQGCYNKGGVAQSGGTHDLGGVVDLPAYDWRNKVKVAADLGAFAYHRPFVPGLWGEHIHLGIRDHGNLAPAAQRQQGSWDSSPPRDALRSNSIWKGYHPGKKITFQYPLKEKPVAVRSSNVTRARDEIVTAIHSLSEAAAYLSSADAHRTADLSDEVAYLKEEHKALRAYLKKLPLR